MKELKIVNELDLGVAVNGSYVVGNYIYILADVLYRAPISGDSIGTPEPLSSIVNPNSIVSDGTYLYVAHTIDGNYTISAIAVDNFNLLATYNDTFPQRLADLKLDLYGNAVARYHATSTIAQLHIYSYNPALNMVSRLAAASLFQLSGSSSLMHGHILMDNLIVVAGGGSKLHMISWDGNNLNYISEDIYIPLTSLQKINNEYAVAFAPTWTILIRIVDGVRQVINFISASDNLRAGDTDGTYI